MTHDGGLRVNHGELDTMSQDMNSTVKKLEETLDNLENEVAPKVATWSGGQQQAYRTAKATWDQAMLEMVDLLNKAQLTVSQSNTGYRDADKRGAARFEF